MSPWKPVSIMIPGVLGVPGISGYPSIDGLAVWDDDAGGAPAPHAPTHTGGLDQIANATPAAAGLMSQTDKAKADSLGAAAAAGAGDLLVADGAGGSAFAPHSVTAAAPLAGGGGIATDPVISLPAAAAPGTDGYMQGTDKDKLDRLADPTAAPLNYILFSNGGGASVWAPNALHIDNVLTVGTGTDADHSNIHDAVDAAVAAGAGPANWWLINVYPGIYSEVKTTIPAGVVVSAVESVRSPLCDVRAFDPLDDLFLLEGGFLINLQISGVSDPLRACVRSSTAGVTSRVNQCRFANCSTGIWAEGGSTVLIATINVTITGAGQAVDTLIYLTGANTNVVANLVRVIVDAAALPFYPGSDPIRRVVHGESSAVFTGLVSQLEIQHNTANQAAIEAGSAAHVDFTSLTVRHCHVGVLINAGVGATQVHINAGNFRLNDLNWEIQNAAAQLFYNGSIGDHSLRSLVAGATECTVVQEITTGSTEVYGPFNLEYVTDRMLELSKFVEQRHSSVVGLGGCTITDEGGLDISITAGTGWVHRPAAPYQDAVDVSWNHQHHTLTDNATNYVYVDAATGLVDHGVVAPGVNDLLLFEVLTAAGDIRFMHAVWTDGVSRCKLLENYLRTTRRVMLNTGLAATINADPHYWDLGGGSYYYGLTLETITGGAQYPFDYFYGAGGASTLAPAGGNHVDLLQYDNAGALAALGAGSYRSDTLFITSDGKASIILGSVDHGAGPGGLAAAQAAAEAAAPTFLYPTVFIICKMIVLQATGVVEIQDLRTTATTTVAPGAADHNLLANLTAPNDAHTQYLLASGARAMAGDLAMGGNSVTGVNLVDGVDVGAHAARHDPGGLDALTQGLPTPIQAGDAQAMGGAASLANSAHVHAVATAAPVSVGAANAIGAAATLCHSDHVHAGLPRTAGDFATFALKATPAAADVALIEDSAAAGAKKSTTVGAIAAVANALTRAANDFTTFAVKAAAAAADVLLIEDSAAAGAKKYVTVATAALTRLAGDFGAFPLKAIAAPADVILIEDSAAAGAKKQTTVSAVAGAASIFGQAFQQVTVAARSVTALGVFQTKATLTTPALTGTFRVGWRGVIDAENANRSVRTRLYNATDLAAVGAEQQDRLATTAGRHPAGGFDYVVFTGAAKTFNLQFYSVDGGNVGIQDAVVELWRVS